MPNHNAQPSSHRRAQQPNQAATAGRGSPTKLPPLGAATAQAQHACSARRKGRLKRGPSKPPVPVCRRKRHTGTGGVATLFIAVVWG